MEHKGPVFAKPYDRLPDHVHFYYDGRPLRLSAASEEIACFYSRMLDSEFTSKAVFNQNFFTDWRAEMTATERDTIIDLAKCNFTELHTHFKCIAETNKQRTKEEKAAIKTANQQIINEYGFCTINGAREKILNFHIEPPGLFRGRGANSKMGCIKRRIHPEDVIINCSADSVWPKAPAGHQWKEIRHDPTAIWLASWSNTLQAKPKYVMLNGSSMINQSNDLNKYELARQLGKYITKIRRIYRNDWKSDDMRVKQRATALYFIDKLSLRVGTDKGNDVDDIVGCCRLRVKHIQLHAKLNGQSNVVVFDFLGKDSIRYYNEVVVDKKVFVNLRQFTQDKSDDDELFDHLTVRSLNRHLQKLMDGLTAKVFRTFNASSTLQEQLNALTGPNMSLAEKLHAYNRANWAVAVICNHQRQLPKSFDKTMANVNDRIETKRKSIEKLEQEIKVGRRLLCVGCGTSIAKMFPELYIICHSFIHDTDIFPFIQNDQVTAKKAAGIEKKLAKCRQKLQLMEMRAQRIDKNKTFALQTSKLNYSDPRISVAWYVEAISTDKIPNFIQSVFI